VKLQWKLNAIIQTFIAAAINSASLYHHNNNIEDVPHRSRPFRSLHRS